jgi:hypothetical protein
LQALGRYRTALVLDYRCLREEYCASALLIVCRRVRQLEQRVESLIGLISSQNAGASGGPTATDQFIETTEQTTQQYHTQVVTPESTAPADTPQDTGRYWVESPPFQAYDPVKAGVVDEQYAYRVVEEFKTSFTTSFPFVLVETDAPTLRQEQPFLFHAILTVAVYDTPQIQCFLAAELRRQVAHVIEYSRKSLEVLQGLLVYGAWYASHRVLIVHYEVSRVILFQVLHGQQPDCKYTLPAVTC